MNVTFNAQEPDFSPSEANWNHFGVITVAVPIIACNVIGNTLTAIAIFMDTKLNSYQPVPIHSKLVNS